MSKWQEEFVKYVDCYVRLLTEGKEEFFLSLCDVEEELLEGLDTSGLTEYCVIIVSNHNYAQAVKMRNAVNVSKIVLLSGEGVKQIDSLKDFNEYPILAEKRKILWDCMQAALEVFLHSEVRSFLEVILEQSEITLSALLNYLKESMETKGVRRGASSVQRQKKGPGSGNFSNLLSLEKLNRNLPLLGMWKRREDRGILKKGETGRILRASRYTVVESRLTKAVMENKITDPKVERAITQGLAAGNIESIFKKVYFDQVEAYLKAPSKGTGTKAARSGETEEVSYDCSYQYYLCVESGKAIPEIEEEWMENRGKEDSEEEQETPWYKCGEEELELFKEQCRRMEIAINEMNLEENWIQEIRHRFQTLQELFQREWETIAKATPVCLNKLCDSGAAYTRQYLELLSFILREGRIRSVVAGTSLVQMLQTLFCRFGNGEIEMPFYHPVCMLYHMGVERMYRYTVERQKEEGRDGVKDRIRMEIIREAGKQFPIEYIQVAERPYAVDHNTVWKSGKVVFRDNRAGTIYSAVDFRMISRPVLDYIVWHPLLTYIKIAVIDVSRLGGLVQLVNRILQFSQEPWCNIGRVEFLILSAKEEELKKEMSELWDSIGGEDLVCFRFDRRGYWEKGQYHMKKIMEEFDLIIIADNSMLYREPRKMSFASNGVKNRLQTCDLERQVDRYFRQENCDVMVLWDSLQHMAENRGEGFWIWKNRELDNGFLTEMNRFVSQEPDKAAVLLSSHEHILSEIHRTQYIRVLQGGYHSRSLSIIEFENDNRRRRLPDQGEPRAVYSLREFYETLLGIEKIQEEFSKSLEDIILEFGYKDGEFSCGCKAVEKDGDDPDREWAEACVEWIYWQVGKLSGMDNILGSYFQDALLNCLLAQAENLPSVLLAERLYAEGFEQVLGEFTGLTIECKKAETAKRGGQAGEKDCMEAMKLHEILCFVREKASIDEQAVSQFRERYDRELLERLIKCDDEHGLLPRGDRDKLQKILERTLK